jgi:polysaccharide deacetylase 2 family uncharacterized protein YibQ
MSEQKTEAAENKKAKKASKKASPKIKKPKSGKISLNKIFIGLNALALVLLVVQAVTLLSSYSNKTEEMFEQGRVVSINPLNNNVSLKTLSDAEILAMKLKFEENSKQKLEDEKPSQEKSSKQAETKIQEQAQDFVGPAPLVKIEEVKVEEKGEVYVPMPLAAAEEKKIEEKKVEEPLAPVDYNKANLSVLVFEVGMKQSDLELLQDMPKEVSVALSPYADELQKKIDFFARDGRQVMINLKLQSSGFPAKDNGPLSIQVSYDEPTINLKLASTLDIASGYIGALAVNDEVVTNKFDKLSPILRKLTERGLFFGYFKSSSNLNVENDAKPLAVDVVGVDYLIDEQTNIASIKKQLDLIKEDLLVNDKRLVVGLRTYPNSVKLMKDWLKENRGNKIQLAPISYFVTNN